MDSLEAASEALSALHDYGARFVTITSSSLENPPGAGPGEPETLHLFGSYRARRSDAASDLDGTGGKEHRFLIRCPKLPAYFTGTGDLFAALLLAHLHFQLSGRHITGRSDDEVGAAFRRACEIAVTVIQGVLKRTMDYYLAVGDKGNINEDIKVKCTELRLIQCRDILATSAVEYNAEDWPS